MADDTKRRAEAIKAALGEQGVEVAHTLFLDLDLRPNPAEKEAGDPRSAAFLSIGNWNSVDAAKVDLTGQALAEVLIFEGDERCFVACPYGDRVTFVEVADFVAAIVKGRRAYAKHGSIVSSRVITEAGQIHRYALVNLERGCDTFARLRLLRRRATRGRLGL